MPSRWIVALLLSLPLLANAQQGFQADGSGFVLKRGDEVVRFDKGVWYAGTAGKTVRFFAFLWHDNYLYETLAGGKVETPATLAADGSLSMAGTFSARDGSAPVKYSLQMIPTEAGVRVKIQMEKSAALKLSRGPLWLHLFGEKPAFTGQERLWVPPSAFGTLVSPVNTVGEKLYLGLGGKRALCLIPAKPCPIERESLGNSFGFRMGLLTSDFDPADKVEGEFMVTFADLPDRFPGEITAGTGPLALRGVSQNADRVGRYEKLELTVDLGATYENPYDPDQVALDAEFVAPSGKRLQVPGFFMLEQQREAAEGREMMRPLGNGVWKLRFAPAELGKYTWSLTLKDRTGKVSGGAGSFECVTGDSKGFLRPAKADPHYLAFDNGEGYFAIGHNLPTYHTTGQLADEAVRKMAAAGENYNRWWMHSGSLGIEWTDKLGWYRQDTAARVDYSLDLAKQVGMYYMMCMDTHQDFRSANNWSRNPFNAANGGPCAKPADFFTDATAKELYRKRLRYTVARWGYSPNVLCWEFGNEIEGWEGSTDEQKLPWTREMSEHLRGLDPFGHMITTSFWGHTGPPDYWELPDIDIVQTHLYTNNDGNVAEPVRQMSLLQWNSFAKPHIFGEFGINARGGFEKTDPQGWGIHNGLWAGLTSFCAGGPMPWWHENYIEPFDLYFHFTAIANFSKNLPLGTTRWEPLETTQPEFQDRNRQLETRDIALNTALSWGKPARNEYVVLPDGTVEGEPAVEMLLQGQGHADLKNPPTFVVNYPQEGKFLLHISTVSNSGLLKVWVDDQQVAQFDLPCGENLGKSSVWREQWTLWETTYDTDLSVTIPAGKHRIRVDNDGKDWIKVTRLTFTGCQLIARPRLLVAGMKSDPVSILWIQNRDSDWYNYSQGEVKPVAPSVLQVSGLADGAYRLEWWKTWKGELERSESVTVTGGKLELKLPELGSDVAMKLWKL